MSEIVGPAAAKAALMQLLADIRSSLAAAGPAGGAAYATAIDEAQRDLDAFSDAAHAADPGDAAEVAEVHKIKEVAFDTRIDLSLEELEGNIALIEDGAKKLSELADALGAQTASNIHAAASIGLKPVKDAIDSMTGLVNSVKALKANLKASDPDEAKVAAEIDKLVAQFETLRKAVSGSP